MNHRYYWCVRVGSFGTIAVAFLVVVLPPKDLIATIMLAFILVFSWVAPLVEETLKPSSGGRG
jgi:hypothetical protein